jgi:hypothetical protein
MISPAEEYQSSIITVSASSTLSHKMSEVGEDKSAPTGETPASAEQQPAETETTLTTTASGTEAETSNETSTTESKPAYTEMASNVAGSAAAAAAGVKDSVFSMFGGGGAKEKKAEEEDDAAKDEPSGSSKAAKDKEADDDVRLFGAARKLLNQAPRPRGVLHSRY